MEISDQEELLIPAQEDQDTPSHLNLVKEAILIQVECLKELQTSVSRYYDLNTLMMNHYLKEDEELLSLFNKYKASLLNLTLAFMNAEPISATLEQEANQE